MAPLLSREKEHELCLSGRLSSNIIRGPTRSENNPEQSQTFSLQITAFSRRTRAAAFSSPVSSHYARNAWDHDPHLATKYDEDDDERLAFLDSGFPTEALVKKHAKML